MRIRRKLGILLLSIWLILEGLIRLTSFDFRGLGIIMGILALLAGILLLVER